MNSDLSSIKIGEYIWTIRNGWVEVEAIDRDVEYMVLAGGTNYTANGLLYRGDDHPSAFVTPPTGFDTEPKPYQFKKGDKVIADGCSRRYFSHMEGEKYHCFLGGGDEWASKGKTVPWNKCRLYIEGEDD